MTAALKANHTQAALKLTDKLTQHLRGLARESLYAQMQAINYRMTASRRNDNATSLLKRAAMALSKARAEDSTQPIAL